MRGRWLGSVVVLAVAAAVVTVAVALWPRGVRVTVTNRGPEPLADVVVHVTGGSHSLGTLGVGESRTVSVRARSESAVELEFTDRSGQRRLNAGGYLEPGYEGLIEIELVGGAIVRHEEQVRPWP